MLSHSEIESQKRWIFYICISFACPCTLEVYFSSTAQTCSTSTYGVRVCLAVRACTSGSTKATGFPTVICSCGARVVTASAHECNGTHTCRGGVCVYICSEYNASQSSRSFSVRVFLWCNEPATTERTRDVHSHSSHSLTKVKVGWRRPSDMCTYAAPVHNGALAATSRASYLKCTHTLAHMLVI